jgi:hypothetical protein
MVSGKVLHRVGLGPTNDVPLIADCDGTLVRRELLLGFAFAHLGASPLLVFALLAALA